MVVGLSRSLLPWMIGGGIACCVGGSSRVIAATVFAICLTAAIAWLTMRGGSDVPRRGRRPRAASVCSASWLVTAAAAALVIELSSFVFPPASAEPSSHLGAIVKVLKAQFSSEGKTRKSGNCPGDDESSSWPL